jgi:Ca-activated chloride channel family protein
VDTFDQQLFPETLYIKIHPSLCCIFCWHHCCHESPHARGSDNINRKGIDVAIALDVSKSMLATDLAPDRLERAKQFVSKLINEMPDDRVALILFAGKAYLQMPLTIDHNAAQMFVSSAAPGSVPQQGTVISDALKMGANVFNNTDKKI